MALASFAALAQTAPTPPYYSVQVLQADTRDEALKALQAVREHEHPRVEERDGAFAVRVGAFERPEPARELRDRLRQQGHSRATVVGVRDAVAWLRSAEAPPSAAAAGNPAPAAPSAPSAAPAATPPATTASSAAASEAATPAAALHGGATDWAATVVSLEQLGYRDGFTLEGDRGRRTLHFPLPAGVTPQRAQLVFDLEFAEQLVAASAVQFRVNGTVRQAASRGAGAARRRVEIPLGAADFEERVVRVDLDYSLFPHPDVCFSRHLVGSYAHIAAGSGLAIVAAHGVPRTLRAAWSLLPREPVVAARFGRLTAQEFHAVLHVLTLLQRDGHRPRLERVDGGVGAAHIVVAPAGAGGNLRLVHSRSGERDSAFILIDSARALAATAMLDEPWREAGYARGLDVRAAAEWPLPADPEDTVRLRDLGFGDTERTFTYSTDWHIALPFGPLGDERRPARAAIEVYGAPQVGSTAPTVLSAYFNDRLVFSTTLKGHGLRETVEFELPRVQLRARNNLRVVAQRDEAANDCTRVPVARPISISPESVIGTAALTETPTTFAQLIAYQRRLQLYVSRDALAAAERTLPLLVALGEHFWPDVPPPAPQVFEPGAELEPDGPFFVLGDAAWKPRAWVRFDEGRVRIRSNATGDPLMALDFTSDHAPAVLQMVRADDWAGAWLRNAGPFPTVPARRLLLEDENVALLGAQGVQLALRVGTTRDYRVDYPEAEGWFAASGKGRTVLFVIVWLLLAALLGYLYMRSRRHAGD